MNRRKTGVRGNAPGFPRHDTSMMLPNRTKDDMIPRLIALALVAAPLAACAPAPAPVVAPVAVTAPVVPVTPVTGISGLEERQPDACHAKDYTAALGQPGSVIPSLGITRKYRVVEYRGIEPQEYDSLRIVFRLDQSGNIYNIDCG